MVPGAGIGDGGRLCLQHCWTCIDRFVRLPSTPRPQCLPRGVVLRHRLLARRLAGGAPPRVQGAGHREGGGQGTAAGGGGSRGCGRAAGVTVQIQVSVCTWHAVHVLLIQLACSNVCSSIAEVTTNAARSAATHARCGRRLHGWRRQGTSGPGGCSLLIHNLKLPINRSDCPRGSAGAATAQAAGHRSLARLVRPAQRLTVRGS